MNATFYSGFEKRRNSTKRPSGGTTKSVALKEGTSLMHPEFILSSVTWSWNYASAWQYYYYVVDIIAESNGTFRVKCEIDVLASFKVAIGSYTTLISRAASDQDYDVMETIYPAKNRPTTKRVAISNPGLFTTNRSSGCYIIATIGGAGINFYAFTPTQFALFCLQLFPMFTAMTIDTWIETQIQQAPVGGLNTILQSIVMMKWLPVAYSSVSGLLTSVSSVKIGNFEMSTPAGEIRGGSMVQLLGTLITFPDRDDAGARGRWLYTAPFANYSVYIPPFGMINIDPAYIPGAGRQISADIMADAISGNVTLRLYYSIGSSGPKMIGVYNANISQDLKAGGSSANVGGVLGGIAGAIASAVAQKPEGVISSIASAVQSGVPQAGQVGGGISGPTPDLDAVWYAYATYFDPIEENQTELGRPLAEVRQIGSLSGFVQCADAHCPLMGHEEEMIKVNEFLNAGFFYE